MNRPAATVASGLWLAFRLEAAPILLETFDSASVRTGISPPWERVAEPLRSGILGVRADDANGWATRRMPLDPAKLRGRHVVFSAWTRAQALGPRAQPWNGVKVVLDLEDSAGRRYQPQLRWPEEASGWDWTFASGRFRVPADLAKATLEFGLEKVAGKAWFDSLRIDGIAPSFAPPRQGAGQIPRGIGLRGAMVESRRLDTAELAVLLDGWRANLLRWQFNPPWPRDSGLLDSRFFQQLESNMDRVDSLVRFIRPRRARILLDFHEMGRHAFHDTSAQGRLVEAWRRIARRFQAVPEVWGYDLLNEPDERPWKPGLLLWDELADSIGRAIRRIDRRKILVVQPADFGEAGAFVWQKPIGWSRGYDLDPVVYSFHFYAPGELTHQGVFPFHPVGPRYPGIVAGEKWDKNRLRRAMAPAREFQGRHRVPILVGEFACVRWAPDGSAERWMRDVLEILEESGWDWTYHAFREWDGWDLERGQNREDTAKTDHPAGAVVREFLRRNRP